MMNNGYIEIEINGRKAGLKFNMYAVEQLQKQGNDSVSGVRNITELVWAGLCGNAYAKRKEPADTYEEVTEWIDENWTIEYEGSIFEEITRVFTESKIYHRLTNRDNGEPEEDAKKKIAAV